jgi:RNA polymerase sigma-32 factor
MTNKINYLQPIHMTLPGSSLDAYLAYANSIPMLSQEEEIALAEKFQKEQDVDAARMLVLSHLRFVGRVAKGYMGYGLPVADLIQEGTIGLMKAVKRFDPTQGVRLAAFAVHWIKSEIHEFVIRNWRIVRVATTKAQRKLFFNLRGMKKRLGWMSEEDIAGVAADLNVSAQDVREMEARLSGHDMGLEWECDNELLPLPVPELEDAEADPAYLLESGSMSQDANEALKIAMKSLNEREQTIVRERWLSEKKVTLKALAERFGISLERVRQLEEAAFFKMKELLEPGL